MGFRIFSPRWLLLVLIALSVTAVVVVSARASQAAPLPRIGPAADFTLTDQDGAAFTLSQLRGKVVAAAFIYTTCIDVCPILTGKMKLVRDSLGGDFGSRVAFVSVTVDPDRDTPDVLKAYAQAHDASLNGWSFVTGDRDAIHDVAHAYGITYRKTLRGDVDHTVLTTLIDQQGDVRVQYLGTRFDPAALADDLRALVREAAPSWLPR